MKVAMLQAMILGIPGPHGLVRLSPLIGEVVDLPEAQARELCRKGQAIPAINDDVAVPGAAAPRLDAEANHQGPPHHALGRAGPPRPAGPRAHGREEV